MYYIQYLDLRDVEVCFTVVAEAQWLMVYTV